jgi:hypothetical protein
MPPKQHAAAGGPAGANQAGAGARGGAPARVLGNNNTPGAPRTGAQRTSGGVENAPPSQEVAGTPVTPVACAAAGAGQPAVAQKPAAWWRFKGEHAGASARSAEARGSPVGDMEPPADVTDAGGEAVAAWCEGFMACFKMPVDDSPAGVPLKAAKRRKASIEPAAVKEGRAGLDSAAAKAELSAFTYQHVRKELFLEKDGGKHDLFMWLTDKERGYTFLDPEYDAWWSAYGCQAVKDKAVTARASLKGKVKEAICRRYSASPPTHPVLPRAHMTRRPAHSWRHARHVRRPLNQEEDV